MGTRHTHGAYTYMQLNTYELKKLKIELASGGTYLLIPVLERQRQRQMNLCEFEASLVYRGSSRTARATQRNPFSKR